MVPDRSASIMTDDPKPKRHQMWGPIPTIGFTVLLYFVAQIVISFVMMLYPLARGWNHTTSEAWLQNSSLAQFITIVGIESCLVGGVFALLKIRGLGMKAIGLAWPKLMDLAYAIAGFIVYLVVYAGISEVVRVTLPQVNLDQKQNIGFSSAQGSLGLILAFVSLVILPPIAEEIVTRGFLYGGIKSKWPTWIAVIITSGMFATAHLQFGEGAPPLWVAAIDTFTLSLVLIYLREKRKSLAAPMLLHMIKNGLAFFVLFIFTVH